MKTKTGQAEPPVKISITKFSSDEWNVAEAHFQSVRVGPPGDRDGGSQFFELHVIAQTHGVVSI